MKLIFKIFPILISLCMPSIFAMEGKYRFIIPKNEPFTGYHKAQKTIGYILLDTTIGGKIKYYLFNATLGIWHISSFKVGIEKEGKNVDASLRKQGIGINLFKRCIEDIKKNNGKKIEWEVDPIADKSVPIKELVIIYQHIITKHINPIYKGQFIYEKRTDAFGDPLHKMSYTFV